jgi:hypothetical protein
MKRIIVINLISLLEFSNISFNNIEDLIQAIFHYTKNADQEAVYQKIFVRFSNHKIR